LHARRARYPVAVQEQAWLGVRYIDMTRRFVLLAVAVGLAIVRLVSADDNVRVVQMKLRDGGFLLRGD